MWKDNDDKIMDILENIETLNRQDFPVVCPICGEKEGHLYFHRNVEEDEKGGMWAWCSSCCHFAHALYRLPKWWKNLDKIKLENLAGCPDYLEENKLCIDEWVNKLGRSKGEEMDKLGRDELFYKIIDVDVSALEMLDTVENINFQDSNGYSYLHAAVQSGSLEMIKKILNKGADINIKDKFGKTPLMVAISGYNGDNSIIRLLIENGADKETRANSNISCIQLAKMKGVEQW